MTIANDPIRKGQLAAPKMLFGPKSSPFRYAVAPAHSRFDAIAWFVWDCETPDRTDYDPVMGYAPGVIRIKDTYEDAVAGLPAPQ